MTLQHHLIKDARDQNNLILLDFSKTSIQSFIKDYCTNLIKLPLVIASLNGFGTSSSTESKSTAHLACQAISNGTQKLQVLHINCAMIHNEVTHNFIN